MKTLITLIVILLYVNVYGQEKVKVKVSHFNKRTAVLTINGDKFKLMQEITEGGRTMNESQYNQYIPNSKLNRSFKHVKTMRVKPDPFLTSMHRFSTENYLLEYWENKNKKRLVIRQRVPITVRLIEKQSK